jgi:hypothetical protein
MAAPLATIARFEPGEHKKLGDDAAGGEGLEIDLGDGEKLSYGDIVALGDYLGSAGEIRDLASTPSGRQKLRWVLYFSTLRGGEEPELPKDEKTAIKQRYYKLAGGNLGHFSAGGTAMDAYEQGHGVALGLAFDAGVAGEAAKWSESLTEEAFCNHFLTDMFSAGHVRTPRTEIKEWYMARFPDATSRFAGYAAARVISNLGRRSFCRGPRHCRRSICRSVGGC